MANEPIPTIAWNLFLAFCAWVVMITGVDLAVYGLLLILITFDILTGMLLARKDNGKLVSGILLRGLMKKFFYFLTILTLGVMVKAIELLGIIPFDLTVPAKAVVGYGVALLVVAEAVSIIGNMKSFVDGKPKVEFSWLAMVLDFLISVIEKNTKKING